MPVPLAPGQQIIVHHGCYEEYYQMKSMQMANDHYNIGITLQGHRQTITPYFSYTYKPGDIALAPPFLFHRTVAISDGPYERIMIKFSSKFAEPFIRELGQDTFNGLYENLVYHFTEKSQDKIRKMFFDMLTEYEKNTPYREFVLQGMLFRLFTTVLEEHIPGKFIYTPSPITPQIMEAIAYMEKNYDTHPSIEVVARYAGFSTGHFSRLFHAQLGMPYGTYLSNIQIRNVQILLAGTDYTISEIATQCGYHHIDYLSAQFKKKVGMTPGEYRKKSALGLLPQ